MFLTADARRFDAPDLVGYFRLRAWCTLVVLAVLAIVGLAVTHDDAPYVHDGLTGGVGLVLGALIAVVSALATAWLLYRVATGWARVTAIGSVALVVVAWGLAQRPYLIPTSLTCVRGGRRVDDAALADAGLDHRGGARGAAARPALPAGHPRGAPAPHRGGPAADGTRPGTRESVTGAGGGEGCGKRPPSWWSWACRDPGRPPSAKRSPWSSAWRSSRATTSIPRRTAKMTAGHAG